VDLAVLPASHRHRHSDTFAYRLISFVGMFCPAALRRTRQNRDRSPHSASMIDHPYLK